MGQFFDELKRRNVLRVAVAYLAVSWLLVQIVETVFPIFGLSDALIRLVIILLVIAFPLALIFSWLYELTPDGLKLEIDVDRSRSLVRHSGKNFDRAIIVVLALALGYFALDKFVLDPARDIEREEMAADRARSEALVGSYGDKSIAVLPFVNMSSIPEQEYFSDGISEELLNRLAQIPELRVISRSSSFSFKGKDVAIPDIAAQLSVAHVLEGSVRRMGNRVRITAQLIEASTDAHVWSESYDRDLDDIFAVQNDIAAKIGHALQVSLNLNGGEEANAASREPASVNAYDAYLLGTDLFRRRGADNVQNALRQFELSVQLDDSFALGHAQAAIASALLGVYGKLSPGIVHRKALRHLARAEELQPDLAEVHAGRALIAYGLDNEYEAAVEHARKGLALNPSYSDARTWLSSSLGRLGRYDEADAETAQILVNDPLNLVGLANQVELYGQRMQISEARKLADLLVTQNARLGFQAHAAISVLYEGSIADGIAWQLKSNRERGSGDSDFLHWMFSLIGEQNEARRIDSALTYWDDFDHGRDEEGIGKLQRILELDPYDKSTLCLAGDVLFNEGYVDLSLPVYKRLLKLVPESRPLYDCPVPVIATIRIAVAHANAGDEAVAAALMQIAKQDQAARRLAGRNHSDRDVTDAMIAMVDKDPVQAIEFLESSIQNGLRDKGWLLGPVFQELQADSRFIVLLEELKSIIATEQARTLQLICFNNPVPDFWQPLTETCEGVVEQSNL